MKEIERAGSPAGSPAYQPPRLITLGNVHEVTRLMGGGRFLQGPQGLVPNVWTTAYGAGIEVAS